MTKPHESHASLLVARCFSNLGLQRAWAHVGLLVMLLVMLLGGIGPTVRADNPALPPRVLPPPGKTLPEADLKQLDTALSLLEARLAAVREHPLRADVAIYAKAVRFAVKFGEFYVDKDLAKAEQAIERANQRVTELSAGKTPWSRERGLVVRGYTSRIDGSPQPYGLVIPKNLDLDKPAPLYVWLHGRGDKQTDLHFIHERQSGVGQIAPSDAIVLHPFGRHCLGFKSAGEIDVLEAVEHVQKNYRVDLDRIVLIGFSMGGAGAWHLGAHYTDRWCAVCPGAGFAETAQYIKLAPENYPPTYEQRLWGAYDVPGYVRNLFNVPVIAYSGENDKQIQSALIMEAAFAKEGRQLDHRIGPGVEHKYEPATLAKLLADLKVIVEQGRDRQPREVFLQTQTLRYPRQAWVEARSLGEHWRDARVDAKYSDEGIVTVSTRNVTGFRVAPPVAVRGLNINGQVVSVLPDAQAGQSHDFQQLDGKWDTTLTKAVPLPRRRGKTSGQQGPIDDAFLDPFLVVTPSGKAKSREVERWVAFELAHLEDRWQSVFRGELPMKRDDEVTDADIAERHLVLFGDAESNGVIRRINGRLPINWPNGQIQVGDRRFSADRHVPLLVYPNPLNPEKYVVLNSGPTFRAAHDRTNSLQNPKLPDWAIVDITRLPDAQSPGQVVAADFFDERWELRREQP